MVTLRRKRENNDTDETESRKEERVQRGETRGKERKRKRKKKEKEKFSPNSPPYKMSWLGSLPNFNLERNNFDWVVIGNLEWISKLGPEVLRLRVR